MGKRIKELLDKEDRSERRRLINDGLLLVCTAAVLVAMVLAWFVGSNKVRANGVNLTAIRVGSVTFDVFRLDPTGTQVQHDVEIDGVYYNWTEIEFIDFTNMQPNEAQRYKVIVDGGGTTMMKFSVESAVRGTTTTSGTTTTTTVATTTTATAPPANAEPYQLFNFLAFREMAANAAFTTYTDIGSAVNPPLIFNAYAADGHGIFVNGNLKEVDFPVTGSNNEYIFDLYMNKTACPFYSGVIVNGYVEPIE